MYASLNYIRYLYTWHHCYIIMLCAINCMHHEYFMLYMMNRCHQISFPLQLVKAKSTIQNLIERKLVRAWKYQLKIHLNLLITEGQISNVWKPLWCRLLLAPFAYSISYSLLWGKKTEIWESESEGKWKKKITF